jgi:hypothetical protein
MDIAKRFFMTWFLNSWVKNMSSSKGNLPVKAFLVVTRLPGTAVAAVYLSYASIPGHAGALKGTTVTN